MEQRRLTLSGINIWHLLHMANAVGMIAVSLYLTDHYYETIFPSTLGGGKGLCDLSQFWNCDTATHSPLSSFLGVPTSLFGLIMGLVLLMSSIMPSENQEKTASALTKYNLMGCLILFGYSVLVLGSLCPMCSLYYVMSAIAASLFFLQGLNSWLPSPKVAGTWAAFVLIGGFAVSRHTQGKIEAQNNIAKQVTAQYGALANYGDPDQPSPFRVHSATKDFGSSAIRISVFSDFQCPFCKVVAEQLPSAIRGFEDKVNIQYFFYPLDSACNTSMKHSMHVYACQAAQLAACDESKFLDVHDDIFEKQEELNAEVLREIAKKHGLEECFNSAEAKTRVETSMLATAKYNLKSTPTIIINGKKIEGSVPTPQLRAIFNYILGQNGN